MLKKLELAESQRGFGLIEVIIATAIISVLALGITTLITDMFRMQKKSSAVASITQMRTSIISAVQNGEAWAVTAADAATATGNPEMTCMIVGATLDCNEAAAPGYALNLKDPQNNEVFYARAATRGFQSNGTLCTGFPSEGCPFSWNLTWIPTCPGAATACMTPTITVAGVFEYFAGADPLPGGFNPANYSINVLRGSEAIRNDPLIVVYRLYDAVGEPGGCMTTWHHRNLNEVDKDQGNNILNKSGTAPVLVTSNQIQLRAGTYNCRVQVPGFKNGGNRIRITRVAGTMFPDIVSAVSVASMTGGSTVVNSIETTLIFTQDTTFRIEHNCTSQPSAAPYPNQNNNFSRGVPLSSGGVYTGGVIYTSVACTRTS